ncbi:MAG: hypothetical protein AVO39_11455 [delta proteobacterium MLS_D]|jgi:uncharacterized protein|nr:MAG: hypothetical protein AVO39_11455 [delta proteobacterium MLS_D]
MVMNVKRFLTILMLLFPVIALATGVQAEDRDGIINSMKERYPALLQAKEQGLIGEARDGFVGLVRQDVPDAAKTLVESENSDRRMLFQIIARDTSATNEEVARQNGIRMYLLARDNHFLQDRNSQWVLKRDLL